MAKQKYYIVEMLQGWRETLNRTLRNTGDIVQCGYTEGSTGWAVLIRTDNFTSADALRDWLRKELNFDGWLKVQQTQPIGWR